MDNAAKALLMAAEILIAILILTLAVYAFVYYSDVAVTYEKSREEQEIQKFNNQFTKYLGQEVTIQEMVTLVHLAKEYNSEIDEGVKSANNKKNKVEIVAYRILADINPGLTEYKILNLTSETDEDLIKYIQLATSTNVNENITFECRDALYNDDGSVYKINFYNF